MLFFLRQVRRKLMNENKISTYLLYSVGEIILVVIGILIAVQIDGWNEDRQKRNEELDSYQDIIDDLKKDAERFNNRIQFAKAHLDCFYRLNAVSKGEAFDNTGLYDFIVMTITFDPTTKSNHQSTIQDLSDLEIRSLINLYFANEYRVVEASEEFNKLITEVSRPYVLEEMNAFSNDGVFIENKYVFPPTLGKPTLDREKVKELVKNPKFIAIISELRMSAGLFLAELQSLNDANTGLVEKLQSKLK